MNYARLLQNRTRILLHVRMLRSNMCLVFVERQQPTSLVDAIKLNLLAIPVDAQGSGLDPCSKLLRVRLASRLSTVSTR